MRVAILMWFDGGKASDDGEEKRAKGRLAEASSNLPDGSFISMAILVKLAHTDLNHTGFITTTLAGRARLSLASQCFRDGSALRLANPIF